MHLLRSVTHPSKAIDKEGNRVVRKEGIIRGVRGYDVGMEVLTTEHYDEYGKLLFGVNLFDYVNRYQYHIAAYISERYFVKRYKPQGENDENR